MHVGRKNTSFSLLFHSFVLAPDLFFKKENLSVNLQFKLFNFAYFLPSVILHFKFKFPPLNVFTLALSIIFLIVVTLWLLEAHSTSLLPWRSST